MLKTPATIACSLMLASFFTIGCNSSTETQQPPASDTDAVTNSEEAAETEATGSEGPDDEVKAELAKLSPEDAASAEQQRICPVSGQLLGSMGPPIKVEVDGREVWICCEGCRDPLLENPEKHLASLEADAESTEL